MKVKASWMVMFGFLLSFSLPLYAADKNPEISALMIQGLDDGNKIKVSQTRDLVYTFKSSERPDEVVINYYGSPSAGHARTINVVYSSKNGDVKVEVAENEGMYQITATRKLITAPFPGTIDVTVWITTGGKKSNQLKERIETTI